MEHDNLRAEIDNALNAIPEREAEIIRLWFGLDGEPQTTQQIGEQLDMTNSRVREIGLKGLVRLTRYRPDLGY